MSDRPRSLRPAPRTSKPEPDPSGPALDIRIQSRRWREVEDLKPRIGAAITAAVALAPVKPAPGAELNLLLTDDRRIRIVNRDWRGFDKATNVLSFPAAPPERIGTSPVIGDIVLAYETLVREAQAEDKAFGDHLSHLVVHGLLHLLGEDHDSDAQAQRMEALETAALARLGIADPYAHSEPEPEPSRPASGTGNPKTRKPQPAS